MVSHFPLEAAIEARAIQDIKARWPKALTRKMNGSGNRDWPDRLVILGDATPPFFIEFKRPGEKPRPSQQFFINLLREAGMLVFVVQSRDEAVERCQNVYDDCHEQV